jgi:hypothetical protein
MRQKIGQAEFFLAIVIVPLLLAANVYSQDTFFKGKTMRIIVGGPPGGGFDTYARMIARQMSKHIGGEPTIIVENMPGAGMMIAANHIYKASQAGRAHYRPFHRQPDDQPNTWPARCGIRHAQICLLGRSYSRPFFLRFHQGKRHCQYG